MVFAGGYPEPGAPTREIVEYLRDNRTLYLLSLFLEAISLGLSLWFLGGLRLLLVRSEDEPSGLPSIAFGAGVVFTVMILVEDAALAALANVAGDRDGPASVNVVREFAFQVAWPFARPAVAVLLLAVALAVARTHALPRRVVPFTYVVLVANLAFIGSLFVESGPYASAGLASHLIGTLSFEVWILAISVEMLRLRG